MHFFYYLVIFVFCFSSCSSSEAEKENKEFLYKYTFASDEQFDELEIVTKSNEQIEFRLKHLESEGVTFWFEVSGVAKNKYPKGRNLLPELDPSGEGKAIKLYEFENENTKVNLLVPITADDNKGPYLNIEVFYKTHDAKLSFERMLVLLDY